MTIAFKNVHKSFGSVEALRSLSLTFPEHGTIAIMGPSGCGKTTILQLLAGLIRPTSGTVQHTAQRIAYVFQEPRLLPWRTVLDNICLARENNGVKPKKSALEWLEAVGLDGCAERYPEALSGGMRQRVAIARALYCDSDLLLMDEPFQGLDEEMRSHIFKLIREARKEKHMLTILVTHDHAEAVALADTILTFESTPASTYRTEHILH